MISAEQAQLEAFVGEHYGKLCRYLHVRGCPYELAEELAGDAVKIVALKWAELTTDPRYEGREPRAYLYKVATRRWHKHLRERGVNEAKWRRSLVADHDDAAWERAPLVMSDPAAAVVDRIVTWGAVKSLLLQLSEKEREVLWLRHAADLSTRQTAEILKIPEGTVKARLHDGIKHFKDLALAPGALHGTGWEGGDDE